MCQYQYDFKSQIDTDMTCTCSLPHQLQNLIAIVDFEVQLFLLQVAVSEVPHLPPTFAALRSQKSVLPSTSTVLLNYISKHFTLDAKKKGRK